MPSNGGPPPGAGINQIGGPPSGPGQYPPPQMGGPPGQHNMRGYHQGPPNSMGGHGGAHQQPPTGPTPTLNQLLQSSGGNSGGGPNSGSVSGGGASGGAGHPRYPPTTGYEHSNSYGVSPHPLKTEQQQYPPGPGGWPSGPPPTQSDRQGPPPPQVNNYGHPPPQHMVDQQQSMYRQVCQVITFIFVDFGNIFSSYILLTTSQVLHKNGTELRVGVSY